MARRSALRASDADREHVAERLRNATAEGRLLASELEERLGTLFSARTYGELDALVSDLPAPPTPARRLSPLITALALFAVVGVVALAVLALAVMVVTGAIITWGLWGLAAWLFFGRGSVPARRRPRSQVRFAHRRTLL
jgi:hypothetical protein